MSREYSKLEKTGVSEKELEKLGAGALRKAAKDGDIDSGSVMAGQISGLINKEQSAKEIIDEITLECKKRLKIFGGYNE